MADIFNTTRSPWTFTATIPPILYGSNLPLLLRAVGTIVPKPKHSAQYGARVTKGMDFGGEDHFDFAQYNRILWKG